jgi:hypothetical protein
MAAKDHIGKASEALGSNEYLKRLIEDDELRGSLLAAYGAARGAYGRMSNGKPATKAIFEDKKLQRELSEAAGALRNAANTLKQPPPGRRSRGGFGHSLVVLVAGAVLALALSEGLRTKVLDMMFGAEEEFDYSSTTMPAQETPAAVGAEVS